MNIDPSSNNVNKNKVQVVPLSKLMNEENEVKALNMKQLADYIQKNIRCFFADKNSEYFELPSVKDDTIEEAFVYKVSDEGKQSIRLGMKAFDKDPIALTIAEGNYEQICSKVDHQDFTKNFVKKINRAKKYFMY